MILDEIVARTRERVTALAIQDDLPIPPHKRLSLEAAIRSAGDRNAVIAELKYASPSEGSIRTGPGPAELAREFARGGCVALSVLTEPDFFRGSLDNIGKVRNSVVLPVLRKDFVIDERQLYETRTSGANAILLIAGLLGDRLGEFTELAADLGLEPLIEVHSEREMVLALRTDGMLIGINNRDLTTMKVDTGTTLLLAGPAHDAGRLVVSESGIGTAEDIIRLKGAADAFLIGTAIMSADDPKSKLEEFVYA
jgi:indole-3-glycerol phosphate synthase